MPKERQCSGASVNLGRGIVAMAICVVFATPLLSGCHPSDSTEQSKAASSEPAPSPATIDIRSGVYTDAQARRGDKVYAEHCAACHLPSMMGKEPAPQLAGDLFMSKWRGLSVGDLYNRIRVTMPVNTPGSLTPEQYADLVALTLQANNFPAGDRELRADPQSLGAIKIR